MSTPQSIYFKFSIERVWIEQKEEVFAMLIVPFPEPVNTKTSGQIPEGSPWVAISSPTEITAALAAAKEGYM